MWINCLGMHYSSAEFICEERRSLVLFMKFREEPGKLKCFCTQVMRRLFTLQVLCSWTGQHLHTWFHTVSCLVWSHKMTYSVGAWWLGLCCFTFVDAFEESFDGILKFVTQQLYLRDFTCTVLFFYWKLFMVFPEYRVG